MMTPDQIKSASLPIIAAAGGAAVTFGLMSAVQVTDATQAFNDIWNGAVQVSKGVGAIATIATTVLAGWRATKANLAARAQVTGDDVHVVTSNAKVAAAAGVPVTPAGTKEVVLPTPLAPPKV